MSFERRYLPIGRLSTLENIPDVTLDSIASGEILVWDGSGWINQTLAEAGLSAGDHSHALNDLTDITLSSVQTNEILSYDGADWVNTAFTVSLLSDVTITGLVEGESLQYDGSDWVNLPIYPPQLAYAGI